MALTNLLIHTLLFLIGLQSALGKDDEETKWPDHIKDGTWLTPDLPVELFKTYIAMYYNNGGYKVYKVNRDEEYTFLFKKSPEPEGGTKMRFFQATIKQKECLIWIQKDDLHIYPLEKNAGEVTFNVTDGYLSNDKFEKSFILDHYLFFDGDKAYDLSEVISNRQLNLVEVDKIVLSDGQKLKSGTTDIISNACFKPKTFCASSIPKTKWWSENLITTSDYEMTIGFDEYSYMYIKYGDKIGLTKNNRAYYYPWDFDKAKEDDLRKAKDYFIPNDLDITNKPKPEGTLVMLFPFIHIEDEFMTRFRDPNVTLTTTSPTASTPTTLTTPDASETTKTVSIQTTAPNTTSPPHYDYPEEEVNYDGDYGYATMNSSSKWLPFALLIVYIVRQQ